MKREFLENLDIGEGAKLSGTAVDAIMAEYEKSKTNYENTISTLNGQLKTANDKLTGYDPEWKTKAETERQKLEKMQFDFALEKGVSAAGPRNAKAVMALIDRDKLKLAGGEVIGLDAQLAALKKGEDTAFLFGESKPKDGLSHEGGSTVGGQGSDNSKDAANNALRAFFGGEK